MTSPTVDEQEDLLLSCRYGELDEVKAYVDKFGGGSLGSIRDENGNSLLHMCINGSGRISDILDYLLPLVPPDLLAAPNSSKSTPLHWAALNEHLEILQRLVQYPKGTGAALIDVKNAAGRTPLGEAELAQWDEGAKYLVSVMNLENAADGPVKEVEGDERAAGSPIELEAKGTIGKLADLDIGGNAANGVGEARSR